jgi:DNA-binding transcriptional LysR family regulator
MVLFKTVEQMMNQITLAESTLLEMEHVPKGPLSIGASAGIISRLLLNNAKEFTEAYPELELSIVLGDNPPNFAIGEVKAAVFPYISDQDNLVQEYLRSFYMKLFASPEYLEKFGIPQSPNDLDYHRLLSYGTHPHPFANLNWHLALGCPQGEVRRPYMQVNLGEKLRGLAKQGVGIVTLDQRSIEVDLQNTLVPVLPEIKGPQIDFYYIYPKHLENSLRIKALEDYFKMVIVKNGWNSKEDNFKI